MADQIDLIVADLVLFTAKEITTLALNIDANLRENPPGGTPVDIGWARANWIPSVGEPTVLDASKREPTLADVQARQQQADKGTNAVLAYKLTDGKVFVVNSVPYIKPLNDGHSAQSPPGFVQFAIEKAIRETESAAVNKAARNRRAAAARERKARPVR